MKVKCEANYNQTDDIVSIVLRKGKNEEEMHSGILVGFYPSASFEAAKSICADFNKAFEGLWH